MAQTPTTPQGAPSAAGQDKPGITPQEKKVYDMVVKQALGFLLKDETAQHIIDKAQVGNPKTAVVEAVMPLLTSIYQSATSAGVDISQKIILAAGIEVLAILAQMMAVAGIIREEDVPSFARDAGYEAVNRHNAQFGGQQ